MKTSASRKTTRRILTGSIAAACAAALLAGQTAHATVYYWDSDGVTAGFGSTTGTWGTSAFWGTSSAGTGATANTTITTADTVNIGTATLNYGNAAIAAGNVSVNSIVFGAGQTTAVTLGTAANTMTFGGTTPTVTVNNTSASATISSIMAGSAGVIKDGAGTLVLGNNGNTFTGGLTIKNGIINVGANGSSVGASGISMGGAGSSGATLIGNATVARALTVNAPTSGVVTLAANTTGNSLTYSGAITLNTANLTVRSFFNTTSVGTGNTTITGGITGTGNLIISNTGNGAGITGATSKIVLSTAAINPTGSITARGDNTGSTALTTISANIGSNVTSFTKEGVVKVILSGTNTFTGGVNISAGTLELGSAGALNSTAGSQNAVAFTSGSTGTLALNGNSVTIGNLSTNATPGTTFVQNGHATTATTLTVGNSQNLSGTFAGTIQNGGVGTLALSKAGTGTLTLSGLNSFTGNVTISAGTLVAGVAGSGGNSALGSVVSTRTINVTTGGTLRFDVGNVFNNNFASASTSLPALSVNAGTVTNGGTATNSALGDITLTGGTLDATVGSGTGYGSWNLNGTVTSTGTSTISSSAGVPITLSAAAGTNTNFNVTSGTLTASAALGEVTATGDERVSSLTKSGAGTMILSGTNTYTGLTTVNGGLLTVQNASALGGTAAGTVVNGTTAGNAANARLWLSGGITVTGEALTISGNGDFLGALGNSSGNNEWAGNVTVGLAGTRIGSSAGDLKISGVIDSGVNNYGMLFRTNTSATVTLSGANTYLGDTTFATGTGGSVILSGGANRLPTTTKLIIGVTTVFGVLDLNGQNQEVAGISVGQTSGTFSNEVKSTAAATLTVNTAPASPSSYSGLITGGISLVKTGADSLTLSGANTYTGATAVNNGTLVARNATALGLGAGANVSVATGATLNYYATADAQLAIGGNLAITGGAGTAIGATIGSTGTSARIIASGDATASGTVTVNLNTTAFSGGLGTYTLVSGTGGGSTLNGATYAVGTVLNNTNFTVANLNSTATDLTIDKVAATPLTTAFWKGGFSGNTNVWAVSDGSTASNWTTTAGGAVQALVPGASTDVVFSATAPTTAPTATVLLADMSVNSLTLSDDVNAFALTADGFSLTVGTGGITKNNTVTQTATIAVPIVLGGNQTWSNTDATNALTVSGAVTGANNLTVSGAGNTAISGSLATGVGTLTKQGAGILTLSNISTNYTGATTISGGTLALSMGAAFPLFTSAVTVNSGTTLQFNHTSAGGIAAANMGAISLAGTLTYSPTTNAHLVLSNTALQPVTVSGGASIINLSPGAAFATSKGGLYLDGGLQGSSALTVNATVNGFGLVLRNASSTYSGAMTVTGNPSISPGTGSGLVIGPVATALSSADLTINGTLELGNLTTGMGWASNAVTGTSVAIDSLAGSGVVVANMATAGNTRTLSVGNNNGTGSDFSGVIANGTNSTLSFTKNGSGTQTLSGLSTTAANNYTGTTTIDQGTLAFTTTSPTFTGGLTFGAAGGNTTAATLDVSGVASTAAFTGAFTVQNNTVTPNTIAIGSKTLATNGNVTIGHTINTSAVTNLTVTGAAGAWTITNAAAAGKFQVGGSTGASASNATTADLTGLATFNANLSDATSVFRVGDTSTFSIGTTHATLMLATTSTITAGTLGIGDSTGAGGGVANAHAITLGTGVNTINANTISIGDTGAGRGSGSLTFQSLSLGSLIMRDKLGATGTANLNLVNSTNATGTQLDAKLLLAGHNADVSFNSIVMATRSNGSSLGADALITFDTGTFSANTISMSSRTGAINTWTGAHSATITIGGGTASLGAVTMAVNTATGTSNGNSVATLNISSGAVTASSINMANAVNTGITKVSTGNVNLTGGSLTLAGNITRTGGTGTENATITLNGGTLNMGGFNIGGAATISLLAQSGTLSNVAQINGGTTALTKTTAGTLTLTGTNTYTGGTNVNAGTLLVSGAFNMPGTGTLAVNAAGNFSVADATVRTTTANGGLTMASGATLTFDWNAAAADSLTTTAVVNTTGSDVIGIGINGTNTPTGGTYDVITAAAGSTLNNASYFVANNNNYTATVGKTAQTVFIGGYASATALTDAYWIGGQLTGAGTGAMALSSGTLSDWASDAAGTLANGVVPGGAAVNVIFGATGAAEQSLVTTGVNLNLGSITFNDTAAVMIAGAHTITLNSTSGTAASTTGALATVTAGSAISVTSFANANNTINANLALGANQTWNVASGKNLTVSGVVSGAFSLTKAGTGTVTLAGTNTYTGATAITAGTVNLTGSLAGTAITVSGTAVLAESATGVIGGAISLTHNSSGTSTLAGANTYTGGTIINDGTLALGHATDTLANTGAVTVDGATAILSIGGNSDTVGAVSLKNGASITGSTGVLTGSSYAVESGSISAILGGAGALTKTTAGTVTLSGANIYTGNTTVTGGTLNITGTLTGNTTTSTLALGTTAANTLVNVSNDVTLFAVTGANFAGSNVAYNQTAGIVNVSSSLTVVNATALTGAGSFNLTGGTFNINTTGNFLVINDATGSGSAYVGGTGILNIANASSNGGVSFAGNGALTVGPGGTVTRAVGSGAAFYFTAFANATGTLNMAGGNMDLGTALVRMGNGGAITGMNGFVNLASGTLTMGATVTNSASGANFYANFAGGTLKASGTLNSPFSTGGGVTTISTIFGSINNFAAVGNTSQNFTGGLTVNTNGNSVTYGNALLGATGNGVAQSNITVTGGTGYIGAPTVTFTGGTLATNGTPASGYAIISGGAVTGIVITSPGTYTVDPTVTLSGGGGTGASAALSALSANAADSGLTKSGAGILTLSGANTYVGATNITGGTLSVSADNNLGAAPGSATVGSLVINQSTLSASTGFTLNSNRGIALGTAGSTGGTIDVASAQTLSYGGIVADNGGTNTLTKNGVGTLALSGPNTYTGATTVTIGTLSITNAAGLGAVAAGTSVGGGATLALSGTIAVGAEALGLSGAGVGGTDGALRSTAGTNSVSGAVTLNASSTVRVDAGTLTLTGGISESAASTLTKIGNGVLDVNSTNANVSTLAALDGTTNVNVALGGGTSVVSVTGGTTKLRFGTVSQTLSSLTIGAGSTVVFTSGAASGAFSGGGKSAALGGGSAVVPEPGTLGLLLVGALGMLNRRRRQA